MKPDEPSNDGWTSIKTHNVRYIHTTGVWVMYIPHGRPRWQWCKTPRTLTEILALVWNPFPASCRTLEQRKAYALMMVRMGEKS